MWQWGNQNVHIAMSRWLAITRRQSGFTLVELMVGIVIAVILVTLTGAVYSTTVRVTERNSYRLDTWWEARSVLAVLERDLKMLALLEDGGKGGYLKVSRDGDATEVQFPTYGSGELGVVRYRCAWNDETKTYSLKRFWHQGVMLSESGWQEEELVPCLWDFSTDSGKNITEYEDMAVSTLEVRFRMVGERVAARLRQLPVTPVTWTDPDDAIYQNIIRPNQQEFVLKVRLGVAGREL